MSWSSWPPRILAERDGFEHLAGAGQRGSGLLEILSVGMSAGGARAKAMIAWNPETNEVRSGQVAADPGFEHWLLKFDGVDGNRDKERFDDPEGYGAIEYAYSLMAAAAGIEMTPVPAVRGERAAALHDPPLRPSRRQHQAAHAVAGRAARTSTSTSRGAYSYEQALMTIRELGLPMAAVEQQFRRMAFNVIARNQDDHVKNIAFLMDRAATGRSPPPSTSPTATTPTATGPPDTRCRSMASATASCIDDFLSCAEHGLDAAGAGAAILDEVAAAVADWPDDAMKQQVPARMAAWHRETPCD